MSLPKVGFIGIGVMGRSMAGHLLAAGYPLTVYTRTAAKAKPLVDSGATWAATPEEAAKDAEVVITMVGYPADVDEVYRGPKGIFKTVKTGALLIDMTTSSPKLARELATEGAAQGLSVLDAPVSGGDIGAREARLAIMVGGEKKDFERALPLFQLMGKNIVHQGPAGSGQLTKLCNQIAIAGGMLAVCESLAFAKSAGLDPASVLKSIESGAAGSWGLSNLGPRILREDWSPGFFVKHFLKDMRLALEAAKEQNIALPGLALAEKLYARLVEEGGADYGTQALFQLYMRHPQNPDNR
ncbi:MAG: NAD(P)-dependent oxidoreductase [Puniceicoccales bacterium]|nr:NAD(P)-dependent oxidoreductase [Puniceicoccales bacterium]